MVKIKEDELKKKKLEKEELEFDKMWISNESEIHFLFGYNLILIKLKKEKSFEGVKKILKDVQKLEKRLNSLNTNKRIYF